MNQKKNIFRKKNPQSNVISSIQENPFLLGSEGRKEWNDRYMNMAITIKHWKMAFSAVVIAVVILTLVVAKIATESRVEPFVVETNNGMPIAIMPMKKLSMDDLSLIQFGIDQFIINARTILNDTDGEKMFLNKVYAYTANTTIPFLHDYYEKNNPFELAAQFTVSVRIINSLHISAHTWQITWDETKRSTTSGNVLSVTRWTSNINYKLGDVNPQYIAENPFGLYITQVTWSQNES
jgi:type IV secretory pathway TrbF-like protein